MQTIEIKELQVNSEMLDAYKKSYLSLGQFAKALDKSHEEAMKLLSLMGVDVVDYDFEDDMKFIDSFL